MFFHNLFSFGGFLLGVTCTLLAAILFRFGKLRQHRTMAFYNLAVAWWGYGAFFWGNEKNTALIIPIIRLAQFGVIFIPVFFLHTIGIFCNIEKRVRKVLIFSYVQAIFFSALLPTDIFIPSRELVPFFDFYTGVFPPLNLFVFSCYLAVWISLFVYGHFLLFRYLQRAPKIIKGQTFFVLLLWGGVFISGLSLFAVPYRIPVYPFGNFVLAIYYCLLTYLIFKFRFIDFFLVSVRLFSSLSIYLFVIGLPLVLALFGQKFLMQMFGSLWWLIPLLTAIITATWGVMWYAYFDRKAQERTLKEQREYQTVLRDASSSMLRIRDSGHLVNLIAHLVTKTAKIQHTAFYLFDAEKNKYMLRAWRGRLSAGSGPEALDVSSPLVPYLATQREAVVTEELFVRCNSEPKNQKLARVLDQLQEMKAVVVVPSFMDNKLKGILILGKKASDLPYTKDDLSIFSILANQAGLAIENAQFYEELKNTHERLVVAEKIATINTMANGLSHQINNRLQALSLIAGSALDALRTFDAGHYDDNVKNLCTEISSSLSRIETNILKSATIVKALLKYAQPDEQGFEALDMRDVLAGALDMVDYKFEREGVDFNQQIPVMLPRFVGNLAQLEEVFFNLLENAYDAIMKRKAHVAEGGYRGQIEVRLHQRGDVLELHVKDNGIGIQEEYREKIFTPFFTTKPTAVKGNGLGLYVVEKIIKAHHGTISITSTYGEGTDVVVVLPVKP